MSTIYLEFRNIEVKELNQYFSCIKKTMTKIDERSFTFSFEY